MEGIYNPSTFGPSYRNWLPSYRPDDTETESFHSLFSFNDMTSSRNESGADGAAAPTGGPHLSSTKEQQHIYCKVLGLEATILAMRPHTPSSSHKTCLFGRWARAPNPVASRLETWQSSWHPYSRRARPISRPFEPKCSRSDRHRLDLYSNT